MGGGVLRCSFFFFFLCLFVLVKVCLFGSGFLYLFCVSESLLLCVHYYLYT